MIKRILVGLDLDSDTSVAIRHALDIAERHGAHVTGLAVVDTDSIEASARGGGIGSMYLGRRVEKHLRAKTRALAHDLVDHFRQAAGARGVKADVHVEEGDPIERFVEAMNFHDLLLLGKEPHFFYSHPQETSLTLSQVVENTVGPTLVVTEVYRDARQVVVAYDGSRPSTKALHSFVQGMPFGIDVKVAILHVHEKGARDVSQLVLGMAREYVGIHGFRAETLSVESDEACGQILETVATCKADLLVAGAHVVSPLLRLARRSTTSAVLDSVPVPLWLDH